MRLECFSKAFFAHTHDRFQLLGMSECGCETFHNTQIVHLRSYSTDERSIEDTLLPSAKSAVTVSGTG